jgi:amino acid transporter
VFAFIVASSLSVCFAEKEDYQQRRRPAMRPSEEGWENTTPTTTAAVEEIDWLRLRHGFWIIIIGFALVAFITIISIFRWAEVTSVVTVVGAVASLVGTVVGAFFSVQVGGVGKERAEAAHGRSEEVTRTALSMLPSEAAEQLRSEMNR